MAKGSASTMGKKKSSSKKKNRSSGSKAAVPVVVEPLSRGWNASEPLPTTPAPAALSRHPTHPIGCRVMVHGLEKAPQHNGIEGFIVDCFEDTGRNGVRLSNGKELKISPANLKIIKLPKSYDPIEQDSDGQSGLHLAVQDIVDSGAMHGREGRGEKRAGGGDGRGLAWECKRGSIVRRAGDVGGRGAKQYGVRGRGKRDGDGVGDGRDGMDDGRAGWGDGRGGDGLGVGVVGDVPGGGPSGAGAKHGGVGDGRGGGGELVGGVFL